MDSDSRRLFVYLGRRLNPDTVALLEFPSLARRNVWSLGNGRWGSATSCISVSMPRSSNYVDVGDEPGGVHYIYESPF